MKKLGCSFAKPRAHRALSEAGSETGSKRHEAKDKAAVSSEAESEEEEVHDFGAAPMLGLGNEPDKEPDAAEPGSSVRVVSESLSLPLFPMLTWSFFRACAPPAACEAVAFG